jgi:hypothetical protein
MLKSLFKLIVIIMIGNVYGQSNNCPIIHTSGTVQVLGTSITVTSSGLVDTMTWYCPSSTYPYHVGHNNGGGEYNFSFSPPIDTLSLNFSGITGIYNYVEEVQLYVNGNHYPLISIGWTNGCEELAVITGAGNIRACNYCSGSGWNGTIISGPIHSLTVKDVVISGLPGGTVFSVNMCANSISASSFTVTECYSYTVPSGDETYVMSGNYMDTIPNMFGADSIMNITVNIMNATSGIDVQDACDSYTWINGITYYTSNNIDTYNLVGASVYGCDSIVTLNLTIHDPSTGIDVQDACDSYTWINGITYYTSNNIDTYNLVGGSVYGCDSIVTLNLTIHDSSTGIDVQDACDSYTWINGITYYASNNIDIYNLVGGSVYGCDSIVTLNLTIHEPSTGIDVQDACDSYTWINGITYYTSNNIDTYNLVGGSVYGCDSIVTLNLTLSSNNASVIENNSILTCEQFGVTYEWLNCLTMTIISGATNQSYMVTTNGDFAVIITNNGCVDTSICYVVSGLGFIKNDFGNELLVHPNPTEGNFSIDLGDNYKSITTKITDLNGRLIERDIFYEVQFVNLKLAEHAGVYLLIIDSGDKKAIIRLVKK